MIKESLMQNWLVRPLACTAMVVGLSLSQVVSAATITLSVDTSVKNVDPTLPPTVEAVSGFRYLVEEDTTYKPDLGVQDFNSLSFEFHKSHNPVAVGDDGLGISGSTLTPNDSSVVITVPDNKNYFVSVVPYNGHTLGGGAVTVGTGNVDKTIRVNRFPIPTAQISIRVFEDNNPVNGAPDIDETGLSHSIVNGQKVPFSILLFDAAGQYGAAGGQVTADAYGNPLGTEYDAAGNITSTPADTNGFVLTPDANGEIIVKHLPPAKYGVQVVPPPGEPGQPPLWVQTSTIEGSATIDAWVKANEPETFVEFGPPGPHVFVGFVKTFDCMNGDGGPEGDACDEDIFPAPAPGTGATISGQIVNNHMARPPFFAFANGELFEGCRVGINLGIAGRTIASQPCGNAATFSFENLPAGTLENPGSYSLSIWDDGKNIVVANHPFNITGNTTDGFQIQNTVFAGNGGGPDPVPCDTTGCDMGQIPAFDWFHQIETVVFFDRNENGVRECVTPDCNDPSQDEVALHADSSATNIRWRDGRIYNAVPIDVEGAAPHEEVFPFFHWLVAEVDFANYKATGATMIADDGGDDANLPVNGYVPQPQVCTDAQSSNPDDPDAGCTVGDPIINPVTGDNLSRVETGTVLTQAFQGFLGQKNVIEFGKTNYGPGENGGISGMAIYAITRAEDDPRFAAAEEWEPGIPRVQLALYQDGNNDKAIDDINGIAGIQHADVDNYPLGWADGGTKGLEDIENSGNDGVWDQGDALEVTWTDSWDDNTPSGCQGANNLAGVPDDKCFDGLRNFNQVRPGVFDGGYAFSENLPSGYYIVKSYTPPGYTLLKEEDKNVDFGDEYAVPQLLPPICVGADHVVPALLSHVTADDGVTPVVDGAADFPAPYATETRPLCDAKHIRVAEGKNAAADFHYFTEVPKAAHVVGGVINDLGNEFNPNAPAFGEKFTPPWIPVAFYDYQGHEITRVYTDQFGKFNAMLPSTNTVNIASPSGMSPNMITACMNDAGFIDNPDYTVGSGLPERILDPNHNAQYSQFCYVFQYMPGGTTYLDTPVLQIAAFAGAGKQLDCEIADTTPMIRSVTGVGYVGPYVADQNAALEADRMLTITSVGLNNNVLNPSSDELTNKFISRDYGFGTTMGSVSLIENYGTNNETEHTMLVDSWGDLVITAPVPTGIRDGRYQLVVTHDNGNSSPMAVTVTVGDLPLANANPAAQVREVLPSNASNATPIQDALDAANRGDLILIAEGEYNEIPIMYEPVYLQGAGAYSTRINARSTPAEKVEAWDAKIDELLRDQAFDLIPGQERGELFVTDKGPGLMVVGPRSGGNSFNNSNRRSAMDGFTVTGASTGGGVMLNGFIRGFTISNNLITGNYGTYSGGVRLGHAAITEEFMQDGEIALRYPDARNRNNRIHHNMITKNGAFNGAGGGISLYNGSNNYRVTDNLICGNFASTDGAGIGHLGKSSGGRILDNQIIFNQSFRQTPGFETDGGGILIAGNEALAGGTLSDGAGHIIIDRNLIQGNQAGAGDGGGIALRRVNGVDIEAADNVPSQWDRIRIRNNSIVNNMAGFAGGAISLKDSVRVDIINNTIANNESTATAGAAFEAGSPGQSTPRVAGIVARGHETLVGVIDPEDQHDIRYGQGFSNPVLTGNIIWHNSSSYYLLDGGTPETTNVLVDVGYNDLGVAPATLGQMDPRRSLLSDIDEEVASGGLPYHSSNRDDGVTGAVFVNEYDNGNPFLNPASPAEFKTIQVAPALDEGGNWLDVKYAPLSINDVDGLDDGVETPSDYHLQTGSVAIDAIAGNRPTGIDIDHDPGRVGRLDIGSDEVQ